MLKSEKEPLDICSGSCLYKHLDLFAGKIITTPSSNGALQIVMNVEPQVPVNNSYTTGEIVKELRTLCGGRVSGLSQKTFTAIDTAVKTIELAAKAAGIGDNDPFIL